MILTTKIEIQYLKSILLIALLWLSSPSIYAVEPFESSLHFGEPIVNINLNKTMLSLIGHMAATESKDIAGMIVNLNQVSVKIYHTEKAQISRHDPYKHHNYTQKYGWQTMVSINEGSEKVRIFSKVLQGRIEGLAVIVENRLNEHKQELIMVNIDGSIDPQQALKVMAALDIDINAIAHKR